MVAQEFNDQDLLAKSSDVRQVTNQYKELFSSSSNKISQQRNYSSTMKVNSNIVTTLANAFFKDIAARNDPNSVIAIPIIVDVLNSSNKIQINQNKFMLYKNEKYWKEAETEYKNLLLKIDDLEKVTQEANDLTRIADIRASTVSYNNAAGGWKKNDEELQSVINQMNAIGEKVKASVLIAEGAAWSATESSKVQASEIVRQSTIINIAAILIALIIGLLLGVFLPKSIVRPIKKIDDAARRIAEGDTNQQIDIKTRDEIGNLAFSFQKLISYMQEMAAKAISISEGDLTTQVEPKSDLDILGNSFKVMVKSLKDARTRVAASAKDIETSSDLLASSAEQAAQVLDKSIDCSAGRNRNFTTGRVFEPNRQSCGKYVKHNLGRGNWGKRTRMAAARAADLTAAYE